MKIEVERLGKFQITEHMKFRKLLISVKKPFRRVKCRVIYEVYKKHKESYSEYSYFVDPEGFRLSRPFGLSDPDDVRAIWAAIGRYESKVVRNEERQLFLQCKTEAAKAEAERKGLPYK